MIGLRIVGGIFAVSLLYWAFNNFRKARIDRLGFVLLFFLGAILLSISVYPSVSNILVGILSIKDVQYKRIIAILIASNFILVLSVICIRTMTRNLQVSFDLLVRSMGKKDFVENYKARGFHPILVVIPAYNEKENLQRLLPLIPKKINEKVHTIYCGTGKKSYNLLYFFLYIWLVKC